MLQQFSVLLLGLGPVLAMEFPKNGIYCWVQAPNTIDHLHKFPVSKPDLLKIVQGPGYFRTKKPTAPTDPFGRTPWTMEYQPAKTNYKTITINWVVDADTSLEWADAYTSVVSQFYYTTIPKQC